MIKIVQRLTRHRSARLHFSDASLSFHADADSTDNQFTRPFEYNAGGLERQSEQSKVAFAHVATSLKCAD